MSQSYGGQRSPGTFQVNGSSIRIRPGYDNTACVMLDGPAERLQTGARVDVLAPVLKDKDDGVFLMVSTVAEQPDGRSSFGLRLRRDTRGIWLMPIEHPEWRNTLEHEELRKDLKFLPDPGGPLLLTIERASEDTFRCSYRKVGGEKSVLVGEFVSSALGSHRELYVGVQAFCHDEIHTYDFLRLQIVSDKAGKSAPD